MLNNQVRSTGKSALLIVLAAVLLPPCLSFTALAQQTTSREIAFPVLIKWQRKQGVSRYRLQIAADEKFQNVFFDRRVGGDRYTVSELSPGYYFWRVAPAGSQVGEFSRPMRFFISGGTTITVKLPTRTSRATRSHSTPAVISRRVRPPASLER